ncbi:hypothetical protein MtrunA17_Chr8g0377161 [Medicago truncatula]|uniref:Uncharacterized protein n=1 Tax=Medicago truncatula TaxID=3880 RepID=A0A396GPL9_MEDTR|nr:hypothetical protein MtrunA17_Chr8g0377161 [Medicago truncatula]
MSEHCSLLLHKIRRQETACSCTSSSSVSNMEANALMSPGFETISSLPT